MIRRGDRVSLLRPLRDVDVGGIVGYASDLGYGDVGMMVYIGAMSAEIFPGLDPSLEGRPGFQNVACNMLWMEVLERGCACPPIPPSAIADFDARCADVRANCEISAGLKAAIAAGVKKLAWPVEVIESARAALLASPCPETVPRSLVGDCLTDHAADGCRFAAGLSTSDDPDGEARTAFCAYLELLPAAVEEVFS